MRAQIAKRRVGTVTRMPQQRVSLRQSGHSLQSQSSSGLDLCFSIQPRLNHRTKGRRGRKAVPVKAGVMLGTSSHCLPTGFLPPCDTMAGLGTRSGLQHGVHHP